jgi:WD40 repeat protein
MKKLYNISFLLLLIICTRNAKAEGFGGSDTIRQGSLVIAGCRDFAIRIMDEKSGKLLKTLRGHTAVIISLAVDSVHGLLASESKDKTIRIWDLKSGSVVKTILFQAVTFSPVAFSKNGNYFTYVSLYGLELIDAYSWNKLHTFKMLSASSLEFINGDKWLAACDYYEKEIIIIDLSEDNRIIAYLKDSTSPSYPDIQVTEDVVNQSLIASFDSIVKIYTLPGMNLIRKFSTGVELGYLIALPGGGFIGAGTTRPVAWEFKPEGTYHQGIRSRFLQKDNRGSYLYGLTETSLLVHPNFERIDFFGEETQGEIADGIIDKKMLKLDTVSYSAMVVCPIEIPARITVVAKPSGTVSGKPEIVVQSGHTEPIKYVTLSGDNRYSFSIDATGLVDVWDNNTQLLIKTLGTSLKSAFKAKIVEQAGTLVIAVDDPGGGMTVQWWDWVQGIKLKERLFDGDGGNWYSRDNLLCIQTLNPGVKETTEIYDMPGDRVIATLPYINQPELATEAGIITGINLFNKQLEKFNYNNGIKTDSIPDDLYNTQGNYDKVFLSPDGSLAGLLSGWGNELEIWDLRKHKKILNLQNASVSDFAFNIRQNQLIVSHAVSLLDNAGDNTEIRNLQTGKLVDTLNKFIRHKQVGFLGYDNSGKLYMGCNDGTFIIREGGSWYDMLFFNSPGRTFLTGMYYNLQTHILFPDFPGLLMGLDIQNATYTKTLPGYAPDYYRMEKSAEWLSFFSNAGDSIYFKQVNTGVILPSPVKLSDTGMKLLYADTRSGLLAYQARSGNLVIVNTGNPGTTNSLPLSSGQHISNLEMSPDAKWLAFYDMSFTSLHLYKADRKGAFIKMDSILTNVLYGSFRFSPDSKYLVCTGNDNLQFYSLESPQGHRFLYTLPAGSATGLVFDPFNANHLLAVCFDGTVRLFDIVKKQLLDVMDMHEELVMVSATEDPGTYYASSRNKIFRIDIGSNSILNTFFINENTCLVTDSAGEYFSTSSTFRNYGFIRDNAAYEREDFDAAWNRPDKVLATFPFVKKATLSLYERMYRKRLSALPATFSNAGAADIPVLTIDTVMIDTVYSTARVVVHCTPQNNTGVKYIITDNRVPCYGARFTRRHPVKTLRDTLDIPLVNELNNIGITAETDSNTRSLKKSVTITYQKYIPPDLYFVGIGLSAYKNFDSLLNSDNDIRKTCASYKQMEGTWFHKLIADTLLNKNVLYEQVIQLRKKLENSKPNDIIVFFYSGHGLMDTAFNYFLSTWDMDFKKPADRGIPISIAETLLDSVPARNKLMILNSCKSGEYDPDKDLAKRMSLLFTDLRPSNGTTVIAATGYDGSAMSGSARDLTCMGTALQMIFNHVPCKNGMVADTDGNGIITLDELSAFFAQAVSEMTLQEQVPVIRRENPDANFRIW